MQFMMGSVIHKAKCLADNWLSNINVKVCSLLCGPLYPHYMNTLLALEIQENKWTEKYE
jgi:hypothetical protein